MQQHKLWDLAGAIPDAQERVRAAAEKEGVSVEEWLHKRLYGDAPRPRTESDRSEQLSHVPEPQAVNIPNPTSQMRTGSFSRSDTHPVSSARRIDETVNAMARLLEANERLQSNANRALAGLTSEIDAATREQAEAFDTLRDRVDGLEQVFRAGPLRQDIDRLDQNLARLSENTQNHLGEAAQKINALVHSLTSLTGTLALTRDEARQAGTASAEKLSAVENRLHLTEASAARWPQIEAVAEAASQRTGKIDEIQNAVADLSHWHSETTNKIVSLSQGLEKIVAGVAAIHDDMRRREIAIEEKLNLIDDRLSSAELCLDNHDAKALLVQSHENIVDEKLQSLSTRADEADAQRQDIAARALAVGTLAHSVGERIQAVEGRQQVVEQNFQSTQFRVQSLEGRSQGVEDNIAAIGGRMQATEKRLDANDAKTMLALGVAHADGLGVARDENEATAWLDRAAQAGEAVAQFRLGARYENGIGVTPSPEQAMRWYKEAARRGNARAMNNLGVAHANGTGVDQNLEDARRWFQAAAELGLADAQFNLGVMYERGLGVEVSLSDAHAWYLAAAKSGDVYASLHAETLAARTAEPAAPSGDEAQSEIEQSSDQASDQSAVGEAEPQVELPQDEETDPGITAIAG